MSSTATSDASRFVGSIPETYDRCLGPVLFEPFALALSERTRAPEEGEVLEVACGTGIATRRLLERLPPRARLVASDLNEPMIAHARSVLPADARLTLSVADASSLPFDDARFDAVVCQFGVMFFPDKLAALTEMRRVARPGAQLLLTSWCSFEENAFARIARETIPRYFAGDPPLFYFTPFGWADPEEIASTVTAAGFDEVMVERVERTGVSPSADEFAEGLVRGNPIREEIVSRGKVEIAVVERAVADALARELGKEPCRARLFAWLATATAR